MPGQHHHSLIHPVDAHAVRQPDHKLKVRHPPEKLHALNPLPREKQKPIRVESAGEIIHHDHRNARPAEMNDKMLHLKHRRHHRPHKGILWQNHRID
mgnify:FL=1